MRRVSYVMYCELGLNDAGGHGSWRCMCLPSTHIHNSYSSSFQPSFSTIGNNVFHELTLLGKLEFKPNLRTSIIHLNEDTYLLIVRCWSTLSQTCLLVVSLYHWVFFSWTTLLTFWYLPVVEEVTWLVSWRCVKYTRNPAKCTKLMLEMRTGKRSG